MSRSNEELVVWLSELPGMPSVYSLGNFAHRVTFSSQQARAFNLIQALFATSRLGPHSKVAVVGAGLAGLTVSVAALTKACSVDLYERAGLPFFQQRGNDTRYVHPNILDWPKQHSLEKTTRFPYLNWTAATVRNVVRQVEEQWRHFTKQAEAFSFLKRYQVSAVGPSANGRAFVLANSVDGKAPGVVHREYDAVILAVGFGEERTLASVPQMTYWENDSLHQGMTRLSGTKAILVSGCGDGGLTDALRLVLTDFDHSSFVNRFANTLSVDGEVAQKLLAIDDSLRRHSHDSQIGALFMEEYDRLPVAHDLEAHFRDHRRDTQVTLNCPGASPLSFDSSLLSRYATFLAMKYSSLRYEPGRISAERIEEGQYSVVFHRSHDIRSEIDYEQIIVRHGPKPAIRSFVSDEVWSEMNSRWARNPDWTLDPQWSAGAGDFYPWNQKPAFDPTTTSALAREYFDAAFDHYTADHDVAAVGIGRRSGSIGYLVTLDANAAARRSETFIGIPVWFDLSGRGPRFRAFKDSGKRLVPIGTGIYNYDAANRATTTRTDWQDDGNAVPNEGIAEMLSPEDEGPRNHEPNRFPYGSGTLGWFLEDQSGKSRYLISASHVLSPGGSGRSGDRIFLVDDDPTVDEPIARLTFSIQLRVGESSEKTPNRVDAAIAKLSEDVRPDFSILNEKTPKSIAQPKDGTEVIGVGLGGVMSRGKVTSTHGSREIIVDSSRSALFEEFFVAYGDPSESLSLPGDSGSIILRVRDHALMGFVFAGGHDEYRRKVTMAFTVKSALRELKNAGYDLKPTFPTQAKPK